MVGSTIEDANSYRSNEKLINMRLSKKTILTVYKKKGGNISATCDALGIARKTFYAWKNKHPTLAEELSEVDESLVDFSESKLVKLISEENVTCILFHLRTKGRDRGYIERTEQDITLNPFLDLMKSASIVDGEE